MYDTIHVHTVRVRKFLAAYWSVMEGSFVSVCFFLSCASSMDPPVHEVLQIVQVLSCMWACVCACVCVRVHKLHPYLVLGPCIYMYVDSWTRHNFACTCEMGGGVHVQSWKVHVRLVHKTTLYTCFLSPSFPLHRSPDGADSRAGAGKQAGLHARCSQYCTPASHGEHDRMFQ